jgi:hypothetical protein
MGCGHVILVEDRAAAGAAAIVAAAIPAGLATFFPGGSVRTRALLGVGATRREQHRCDGWCDGGEKADGRSDHPGPRFCAHEPLMHFLASQIKH